MWSSSTIHRLRRFMGLFLLPLVLLTQPSLAGGVYGEVWAPQKRSQKSAAPTPPAPLAMPKLVPLPQQQVDICSLDGK